MYYELDDAELFLLDTGDYIKETTNMKSYAVMTDESRAKYVEKVILDITRQCSPKKNYGITRSVLRAFIVDVLVRMEKEQQISDK